jgi:putative CocE/NonD family hydrolase
MTFDRFMRHTANAGLMRFVSLIAQFVASLSAGAQQENVLSVMKRIQRAYWKGKFRVEAFGGLIIGPWGHATAAKLPASNVEIAYRQESIRPSIAWFDSQLRVTGAPLNMARVKLFVMGENRWRNESEWPLARTKYTEFYLHSGGGTNTLFGDGTLSTESGYDAGANDSFTYDPRDPVPSAGGAVLGDRSGIARQNAVEARSDVLVYNTQVLTEPIEVTGPVRTILFVATDAPTTDFTAKLADVFPDGTAYNLSDGIWRQAYSQSPSEIVVRVEIVLWPTSNVFFGGIGSGWKSPAAISRATIAISTPGNSRPPQPRFMWHTKNCSARCSIRHK